jgi:ABC-type siderophore export system fused ATPase/permease subunit
MFGLEGRFLAQICGYKGIEYSSPTLASAISNLTPAFTFILAIIFRFLSFLSLCFYLIFTSPYMILLFLVPNLTNILTMWLFSKFVMPTIFAMVNLEDMLHWCKLKIQVGGHVTKVTN